MTLTRAVMVEYEGMKSNSSAVKRNWEEGNYKVKKCHYLFKPSSCHNLCSNLILVIIFGISSKGSVDQYFFQCDFLFGPIKIIIKIL